jgi:hypothetical protein
MMRLADFDPAELVEGPEGMVRWTPNDAYAQAHGNKSEYAGRVRGVSKNILPGVGTHLFLLHTVPGEVPECYSPRRSFRND